jgi:L-aminopeptidase/D-esterase-like protein
VPHTSRSQSSAATDAPLLPHQLERVAKRASLDIFLAFSTANQRAAADTGVALIAMLPNDRINPIF